MVSAGLLTNWLYNTVGQVKNEWDGSVTIDVQGPAKAVKMFVKEVQAGPNPYAKVTGMQIEPRATQSDWQDFKMQ